jgi:ParB family chromosome partitioning protein
MAEMTEINISDIQPNPTQPRADFDEEALEELADSIRQLGLIQPITVKRAGDKYIIISGERRWRASQKAGLTVVPAYIREVDDTTLHAMALVENIQREDLNAIEISLGMQRLVDECGLTQEALAERLGKKRSTVANYLRLLNLPEEVQFAIKGGVISMGHAKALAAVESKAKQLSILKRCVKNNLSVRQVEELVRAASEKKAKVAAPIADEEYPESYGRLVEYLEKFFSQDIAIKRGKNGGGKIIIDFSSDADIEKFIKRFRKL